jgi:hypothetical protein
VAIVKFDGVAKPPAFRLMLDLAIQSSATTFVIGCFQNEHAVHSEPTLPAS